MIAIEQTIDITVDRLLHLDVALPETVPSGRTSVVLVFPSDKEPPRPPLLKPSPSLEELEAEAGRKAAERLAEWEKTGIDPFARVADPSPSLEELKAQAAAKYAEMLRTGVDPLAKYAGCLKGVYPEDAVQYQRELRDEWPD
jgi:hypothetical protein